jgi:diguanylate cyclase (GGDEF)-like protein
MSKNVEDYLKILFSLTSDDKAASTNEISRQLHVAPSSVTVMLKKLDEKGYLEYSPYQGAVLTRVGYRLGEKITRRHRLLECFLYDVLKLGKEQLHDQACEMEHTLFDDTERALCISLKHPSRCPDDQSVIPPCDLQFDSCEECLKWGNKSIGKIDRRKAKLVEILSLRQNELGSVSFLRGDVKFLNRLSISGLSLGSVVGIARSTSPGTPVEITIDGTRFALNRNIAQNIFVEKNVERKTEVQAQITPTTINKRLEERNRQNNVINETRVLLQSCSTLAEIPPIVTAGITRLFPGTEGALFLMNNTRTYLHSVAMWGNYSDKVDGNVFKPDDCWGLRRGRIHEVEDIKIGPLCPHLNDSPSTAPYMCLPLIAKGDILGLLHCRLRASMTGENSVNTIAYLKEPALVFAEYVSLSIANIKLWEQLTDQSIRDPLTGLFNRRYMQETIQREILHANIEQTKIGIILADIDHFKNYNDTYGHEAGDELLMKLADFFKFEIRGSDIACRYGGEEFLLILPGSSAEGTYKRAEHLREAVKNLKTYFHDKLLPSITLSMGIAVYPQNGINDSELIQAADTALYLAKEQGRDRVVIK